MNLKKINIIGRALFLLFCMTQLHVIFAQVTTQYQLHRLSDDPSDDRRPKLAINDQGTVWVAWESDRDGDFDIYGRKFENGVWSDLIEVAQDTNATFICEALFNRENRFFIFGTEVELKKEVAPEFFFEKSKLFFLPISEDSGARKQFLADNIHHIAPYWKKHQVYPNDISKVVLFDQNIFCCYHREFNLTNSSYTYDSLFLKIYESEFWHDEYCDSVFEQYDAGIMRTHHYGFPIVSINLMDKGFFVIRDWEIWHGGGSRIEDIGLFLGKNPIPRYVKLTRYIESYYSERIGLQAYGYGSNLRNIFLSGFCYKENESSEKTRLIKQIELIYDSLALDKKQWLLNFEENIKISQMSALVAFVWSDSAKIYVKTFQDSTWYETQEIPLNGLTHIDHSLNCTVHNNQHIWIAFDAIYNGNKDVYALPLPASFVVDTVMTSIKQSSENNISPMDFDLFQNYPNPFNSSTTIKYQLPAATDVKLEIYNLLGQRIRILVDQFQQSGSYSINWDGTDDFQQSVASGIYLYQLKTKNSIQTNKLIILR